jgi:hypothetical protein
MLCSPRLPKSDSQQATARREPIRVPAAELAPARSDRRAPCVASSCLLEGAQGQSKHPRPGVYVFLFSRSRPVYIFLFERVCANRSLGPRDAAGLATRRITSAQSDPIHSVRPVVGFIELRQPVVATPRLIPTSIGLSGGRQRCHAIMFFLKEARPCVLIQPARLPFRTSSIHHSPCGLWAAGGKAVSWKSTSTAS